MAQDFRAGSVSLDGTSSYDLGLRQHMQSVFNYMGGGLAITGLTAMLASTPDLARVLYGSNLMFMLVAGAPLLFILFMQFRMNSMTVQGTKISFWLFCALMGLSMGILFLIFTHASLARAFFITAATFGATSLWGYVTKRSLAGVGAFMMMGMIGLLIAGVVNLFLMSPMLVWVSSVASVVIFTGLTAYQVQFIKQNYSSSLGADASEKMAVMSALSLYMNFINMFRSILYLTGTMRRN